MSKSDITAKGDPWDTGEFGRDEQFVERAKLERSVEVDDALGLQMISIRLPKKMIEDLKFIAKLNGTGYQPLIRNLCDRFVEHEIKEMIREAQARREQEAKLQSESEKENSTKKAA